MTNQNSPMARWTTNGDTENFVPGEGARASEKRKFISPLNLFARRKQAFPPVAEAPNLDENNTSAKLSVATLAADLAAEIDKPKAPADVAAAPNPAEDDAFGDMQLFELDDDLPTAAVVPSAAVIADEDDADSEVFEAALLAATADDANEPMMLVNRVDARPAEPEAEVISPAAQPQPAPEPTAAPAVEAVAQARPEPTPMEVVTAVPERRGSSRVKTTFLGFERSDGRIEDVFEKAREGAGPERSMYPVGWMVIVDGPGRGTSITLQAGVSQIGRGDDQAVQLNFGDTGISRSNHAAIAYDDEDRKFYLGHGGKSNIVRINGKPVLSTEPLTSGDKIRIGETTMVFVAFCGADFNWSLGN